MMVVSAGREESGLIAVALGNVKAENASIKRNGAVKVADFQMDMSDAGFGGDGVRHGWILCVRGFCC
jgi:hypothetical protein